MSSNHKFRFHCLGIPHTVTSEEYITCAFTQKVLKFCNMMSARGHHIIHYGNEASQVQCDENVVLTTLNDLHNCYGDKWKTEQYEHSMDDKVNKKFVANAITEVRNRVQSDDFLLCFWGVGHAPIAAGLSDFQNIHHDKCLHVVEPLSLIHI